MISTTANFRSNSVPQAPPTEKTALLGGLSLFLCFFVNNAFAHDWVKLLEFKLALDLLFVFTRTTHVLRRGRFHNSKVIL